MWFFFWIFCTNELTDWLTFSRRGPGGVNSPAAGALLLLPSVAAKPPALPQLVHLVSKRALAFSRLDGEHPIPSSHLVSTQNAFSFTIGWWAPHSLLPPCFNAILRFDWRACQQLSGCLSLCAFVDLELRFWEDGKTDWPLSFICTRNSPFAFKKISRLVSETFRFANSS